MANDDLCAFVKGQLVMGIHAALIAPVRTNCESAPILAAASEARIDTCRECWNVPGQVSLSFFNIGVLMLDNSTNVILDT